MANIATNKFKTLLESTDINFTGATVKLMLLKSSVTPTASMEFISEVSAHEISASAGYTAGGYTLASKTDNIASDKLVLDCADISEATATFTDAAHWGAVYVDTGVEATSPIFGFIDSTATPQQPTSQPFNIIIATTGVITIG